MYSATPETMMDRICATMTSPSVSVLFGMACDSTIIKRLTMFRPCENTSIERATHQGIVHAKQDIGFGVVFREDGAIQRLTGIALFDELHRGIILLLEPLQHGITQRK